MGRRIVWRRCDGGVPGRSSTFSVAAGKQRLRQTREHRGAPRRELACGSKGVDRRSVVALPLAQVAESRPRLDMLRPHSQCGLDQTYRFFCVTEPEAQEA